MTKVLLLTTAIAIGFGVQAASADDRRGQLPSFEELDANADGVITLDELEAQAAARFAEADTDGDGGLSAEEILAQRQAEQLERAQDRAERLVDRLDDNGDGLVQVEELADGRRSLDRMFERVDADEDGAISEEEFAEARDRMGDRRNGPRDGR